MNPTQNFPHNLNKITTHNGYSQNVLKMVHVYKITPKNRIDAGAINKRRLQQWQLLSTDQLTPVQVIILFLRVIPY